MRDGASEGSVLGPIQFLVFLMILTQNQNYADEITGGQSGEIPSDDKLGYGTEEPNDLKALSLRNWLIFKISKY